MRIAIFLAPAAVAAALFGGCSPAEEPTDGGFLPSTGGSSSTAGTTATTAGVSATAGATATTGGSSTGGSGMTTGGASGSSTTGGMSGGGNGNVSGAGGGGGGSTGPKPTAGCGKAPGQALSGWQSYDVPLSGQTLGNPHQHTKRTIHVRLPPDYNPATPYRIVYIGVGCQASNASTASYQLWDASVGGDPNAIYVAMDLPNPATNNNCYDNRAGVNSIEWESLDHDHAFVSDKFCIDDNKVYMGGYSSGSWIANMFSCYFGKPPATPPRKFLPNVALRGVMSVAGCWIDGNPTCNGPVAGIWIHDEGDAGANPYSCAVEQKDRLLAQNGCTGGATGPTEPWGADFFKSGSCAKYTNCPAEYPVIFCKTTTRGHDPQNNNAIPGFTKFVSDIEAAGP